VCRAQTTKVVTFIRALKPLLDWKWPANVNILTSKGNDGTRFSSPTFNMRFWVDAEFRDPLRLFNLCCCKK